MNDLAAALAQLEEQKRISAKLQDRNHNLRVALKRELAAVAQFSSEMKKYEGWYEKALSYAGIPITPEQARQEIENIE